jgi:hypothetical protein
MLVFHLHGYHFVECTMFILLWEIQFECSFSSGGKSGVGKLIEIFYQELVGQVNSGFGILKF